MTGAVVSRRYASLHELQTVYSYGDALDLYEIAAVNDYNRAVMLEEAKRNAGSNRR